eukprot:12654797-Prorocentrum_lima.AAC.1
MKVFAVPCIGEIRSGPFRSVSTEVLISHNSPSLVQVLKGYDRCMLGPLPCPSALVGVEVDNDHVH